MQRKIIHIDMDAFFASVEQLDFPGLRGLPIAVGGGDDRGVVAAASYEARKFGVRSAMSGRMASKLCPQLIFVPTRFERYKEISSKIRVIFLEYTDLVEPLSLDEAFLDVTVNKKNLRSASLIAKEIRERIYNELGLTASAGISINKFLAKIASDYHKPNGQKTIAPLEVSSFLEALDIKRFYGVGKKTALKMYSLGIFTGKDLKDKSQAFLVDNFGKAGGELYDIVRGIHHSPVQPNRLIKSIGTERTFEENLSSEVFISERLAYLSEELSFRLKKRNVTGRTLTLKIKYADFNQETRSCTCPYFFSDQEVLFDLSKELLLQERIKDSVRLVGLSVSNLNIAENKKPVFVQLEIPFEY